jgi:hypothetical protein
MEIYHLVSIRTPISVFEEVGGSRASDLSLYRLHPAHVITLFDFEVWQ